MQDEALSKPLPTQTPRRAQARKLALDWFGTLVQIVVIFLLLAQFVMLVIFDII